MKIIASFISYCTGRCPFLGSIITQRPLLRLVDIIYFSKRHQYVRGGRNDTEARALLRVCNATEAERKGRGSDGKGDKAVQIPRRFAYLGKPPRLVFAIDSKDDESLINWK
jgi:hypothetical protein